MIDVGSSVLTTIDESLNMCSGSFNGSSLSKSTRLEGSWEGHSPDNACLKIELRPGSSSGDSAGGVRGGFASEGGELKNGDGGKDRSATGGENGGVDVGASAPVP